MKIRSYAMAVGMCISNMGMYMLSCGLNSEPFPTKRL